MPDGSRPVGLQLVADFVGKPRQGLVVDVVAKRERLVAAIGLHVGCLPVEIDRVLGINLELLGDLGIEFTEARPDARDVGNADIRIGQKIEGRAALAIAPQLQAVSRRFVRRDVQSLGAWRAHP